MQLLTKCSSRRQLIFGFWDFILLLTPVLGYRHQPSSPVTVHIHDESFIPDHILRVTNVVYPLDCTSRYSVVVNGSIPGPELRFVEGDQVWIRVYNDMDHENVTVHWHGLTQRTSPFSDGTPAASQWPIPPHHYFDYEFEIQPGDAGTYYYHTHNGFGAVTAYGPLIIEEPPDKRQPFSYDEDRILMFSDIFYLDDSNVTEGLLKNPFQWSGETKNIALNGRSRPVNVTYDSESPSCSYAVITVQPNRLYRFRFIGSTALSQVYAAFEDHSELELIEVDGRYISPVKVSHIEIHTGQRYSMLFRSKSLAELQAALAAGKTQFWIQMETRTRTLITTSYAVLAYDVTGEADLFTKPFVKPLTLPNETLTDGWLEDVLHPLPSHPYEDTFPELKEVTRRVIVNVTQVTNGSLYWIQHNLPWYENFPQEPYLVSMYKQSSHKFPDYEAALANDGFDSKSRTFPAKIGEVLEIVWQNVVGNSILKVLENHPFHVHGDHIWDAGSGSGQFSVDKLEELLRRRKKAGGPIKRDTTNLYRDRTNHTSAANGALASWRAWRIRVQSPGVWMAHCHILQHMVMGMSTVWVFGDKKDLQPLSQDHADVYLQYGGQAYGNDSYDPKVVHYWHE